MSNKQSIIEAIKMEEIKPLSMDQLSAAQERANRRLVEAPTKYYELLDALRESILREEFLREACKHKDEQIEKLAEQVGRLSKNS